MKIIFLFSLALLNAHFALAQMQIEIRGIVISSETKEPLVGASVYIKGTNRGVITNTKGEYSIYAQDTNSILVVNYIGYRAQELPTHGQRTIHIELEKDVAHLGEVVVVGYGSQKKEDLTGAISSIKSSDVTRLPVATVDQALQGQVAGVVITNNESSPGASPNIRIRGAGSISGGSDPLVVVNGLRGIDLSTIHPQDIASIEILKDASATAIYGSQGANGVILITTKNDMYSKPTLQYDGYISIQSIRKKLDLMNGFEYARNVNRYFNLIGQPILFSYEDLEKFKNGGSTDWQDEIFRVGVSHNHHITLSGGNEHIKYYISGDYLGTEGIVKNSSLERYRVMPYFSAKLSKKIQINLNLYGSSQTENSIQQYTRDAEGSPIYAAQIFPPIKPVYNEDGTYSRPGGGYGSNTEYNPLALALEPIRRFTNAQFVINPSIEYKILKGLTANVSVSYSLSDGENNSYYNDKITNKGPTARRASIVNYRSSTLQNTNMLTYERNITRHYLQITGVYEQILNTFNTTYIGAGNFPTNDFTYNLLSIAKNIEIPYSEKRISYLSSFMGRIQYGFASKYLITLTARSDGSSVFAENNKYAFFPSVALAWNMSKENFLKNAKAIENLKLRISYGISGNSGIQPYQSLSQLELVFFPINGSEISTGASLSRRQSNPDLKWESTSQLDIGIDLVLLKGRISFVADYYRKTTTDLLLERQVVQSSGYATQLFNTGEAQNNGIELSLSVVPIKTKNFSWTSNINFAKNTNKITSLYGNQKEIVFGNASVPGFDRSIYIAVGSPLGIIKGYEYAGVWSTQAAEAAGYSRDTAGSSIYVDQNKDGILNEKDLVVVSSAQPNFTFGWTNTFNYKGIELSVLINGVSGGQLYNIGRSLQEANGPEGTSKNLLRAWTPQNENTDIPAKNDKISIRNSSRWTEDASYLRVKNISLSYAFRNKKLYAIFKISALRLYVTASNLITLTSYSGFDPEANNAIYISSSTAVSDAVKGIDMASYPSQRSYTFGLNITF